LKIINCLYNITLAISLYLVKLYIIHKCNFLLLDSFFISCVHHWSTMPNGTCAKQRDTKKEKMRENTDSELFYQKYVLSERTATKLESIKKTMRENIVQANPMWRMIAGEVRITQRSRWFSEFLNCKFSEFLKHLVFKRINLFFCDPSGRDN